MDFLVFQLQAPLSAWGGPAVGETRGTAAYASQSALLGLLGAAIGTRRDDEDGHAALRDAFCFAVGLQSSGSLLRDYHTTQVPPRSAMKGRPHSTRRDELAIDKDDLSTILSSRDYRQNAACLVAVQPRMSEVSRFSLQELADALRKPKFVLYLGRKSCPPAAPLWPQLIAAASAEVAFQEYAQRYEAARQASTRSGEPAQLEPILIVTRIAFDNHIEVGRQPDLSTVRKDRLIRRKGWQFGDRTEHVAILGSED